mmetsp:Transcript_31167/g.56933  ORF Transcript_31167/g.56933 Transcript_31167/m.56933 type:complete len:481 (+) Transcript_31167:61-1503(+)
MTVWRKHAAASALETSPLRAGRDTRSFGFQIPLCGGCVIADEEHTYQKHHESNPGVHRRIEELSQFRLRGVDHHAEVRPSLGSVVEVVLECVYARDVDVTSLPAAQRAIAFSADDGGGRIRQLVGREHQPSFFNLLVPDRRTLLNVSLSHFELTWGPSMAVPFVTRESKVGLTIGSVAANMGERIAIPNGSLIGFTNPQASGSTDIHFLVLQVKLRSEDVVAAEGPHPATEVTRRQTASLHWPLPMSAPDGALECVYAGDRDLRILSTCEKAFRLPVAETCEVGRVSPLGFFEQLLWEDTQYLPFVALRHLRIHQLPGDALIVVVENLSPHNVVIGGRRHLKRGQHARLVEGESMTFMIELGGCQEPFLEFVLRRHEDVEDKDGELLTVGYGMEKTFFDGVKSSMAEVFTGAARDGAGGDSGVESTLSDEQLFQRWLRAFHSHCNDKWYAANHRRLEHAFRIYWDELVVAQNNSPVIVSI